MGGEGLITVALTSVNPDHRFWPAFLNFYVENGKRHKLRFAHTWRMMLHQAQTKLVESAIVNGSTHILFVEDDMTSFPMDGLDKMLEADRDVICCFTYGRQWPHYAIPLRKKTQNTLLSAFKVMPSCLRGLMPVDRNEEGVVEVDLAHQGFTLIKMGVFKAIGMPWFKFGDIGATDCWFSDQCAKVGIKLWAHMDVRVEHVGINDGNRDSHYELGKADRLRRLRAKVKGEV